MNGAMMVPEFDQEMANTKKMLTLVADEHFGYRPHEKSWTLGELAAHLVEVPNWTAPTFTMDEIDLSQPWERTIATNNAELLAKFDAAVSGARGVLEGATDEVMQEMWTLKTGDEVHFSMPKGVVYRSFIMNHLVHHRAQLSVYLRMLNIPIPGMYGPSADETM